MAKEGVRPSLLLEVTSPSTRKIDLRDKRRDYYRAGVPYYVIVDEQLRQGRRGLRILGYRRGRRGYERLALNRQGRLWLEPVGLWLGQEDGQVRCYDAQGHPLADYTELSHKTEAAERARAEAERARAKAEQARVAEAQARAALAQKVTELEAELRRARGNSR